MALKTCIFPVLLFFLEASSYRFLDILFPPLFKQQEGFLALSCATLSFLSAAHFESVLLNTKVKLPREVVLLNKVLDMFC